VSEPFLAAYGPRDEHTPDLRAANAPTDPDCWRRPYRLGPWRVGAAAILLLTASYLLIAALIVTAAGSVPKGAAMLGGAVVVIAWALRTLRMGIWVSGRGLRRTGLLRTVTLPWAQVGAVRTAQQPVRWLGMPRTVQGQALVIQRARGEELPPLLTDHNADFLGRPTAFDIAADAVEGWATQPRD
jgi:hypothetical protein